MTTPPNFLFIITDQQRADHLGLYGNSIVQTPHIDALGSKGWVAEQFFVATPVCMPNRASLLTGRMPSVHGARSNGIPLSRRATTFVEVLRESGYYTALVGKSHLQNMTGKPPLWPKPEERLTREAWQSEPGAYDDEWGPRWRDDPNADVRLPFYGFEHVDLVIDHGDTAGGHYRRWLKQNYPDVASIIGPEQALPTDYELAKVGQAWRTRVPEELSTTSWIADRTIDQLRACAKNGSPFFLQCSFPEPHHPFNPPGRYWDMYHPDEIILPASFYHNGSKPPHVAWLHQQRDSGRAVKHTPSVFACTEREAREAIALNYGSITHIDDVVGRIVNELTRLGLAESTIIVFTSDHGDFFGDHQLLLKGPLHYNSIIQVPFVWVDPQQNGGSRSSTLSSAIDVAPTILARAGVKPFHGIQGHSLLATIRHNEPVERTEIVVEEEAQRALFGFPNRVRMRTLRTDDWRMSVYQGAEWGELYRMTADPGECVNLWSDPAYAATRAELLERLAQKMIEYTDDSPSPSALA